MNADNNTGGAPAPGVSPETKKRAVQNRKIANDINVAKQMLDIVLDNPAMMAALVSRGFDRPEMDRGKALVDEAMGGIIDRQSGFGVSADKKESRRLAFEASKAEFLDFRETGRDLFKTDEARRALELVGKMETDLQTHPAQAIAAYQAAQGEPYASKLAKRGWPASRLHAAKALAEQQLAQDGAFKKATKENRGNRQLLDASYQGAMTWVRGFRLHAKRAFQGNPAFLEILKMK